MKIRVFEYINECTTIANILRELPSALKNQRGKEYGFANSKDTDLCFDQVFGVDKTITNNIELERQCWCSL